MNKKIFSLVSTIALTLSVSSYADSTAKSNSYLSAPTYGITHFDSSQSDMFPYAVKSGEFNVDLKKYPQVTGGPVNIITLASTSKDYMWGVSSQGVTYINVADGNFKEVSRFNFPGVKVVTADMENKILRQNFTSVDQVEKAVKNVYGFDFYRLYNGIYSVVDNQNVVYANFGTTSIKIQALGLKNPKDPKSGIVALRTLDVSKFLDKDELIAGLGMTYDGKLVIAGGHSITVIDRDFKEAPQTVKFDSDENATNSIAVDEKNGIYLATDKYMRKVVWTGTKLSQDEKDGAWKSEYETSEEPPAIKVGKGTGSTPTLMGFGDDEDKLVVITDGAERMNIVAFWRDKIPAGFKQQAGTKSNRIAGQMQITAGLPKNTKWVQSEQSVVVKGYGAFVVNNMIPEAPKDKLVALLSIGPVIDTPHGAERLEWNPKTHSWKSIWVRSDVTSISTVPSLSGPSNIVFINGYYKDSGWEVTGMDWNTGKTVHRSIFGKDNFGNGAYAIMQFLPNGDLLFNSIAGPIRIDFSK
ncbi:MAG: hypothetical protein KBF12_02430 [Sebaldella sp.]|nr:hypothetical protein [Sebaldella sp.]